MNAFTNLEPSRQNVPTSNDELNHLIADVRKRSGENWQLVEVFVPRKRWFRVDAVTVRYELYYEAGGFPPFQHVNFYLEDKDDLPPLSGLRVNAEIMAAFLVGLLNGMRENYKT